MATNAATTNAKVKADRTMRSTTRNTRHARNHRKMGTYGYRASGKRHLRQSKARLSGSGSSAPSSRYGLSHRLGRLPLKHRSQNGSAPRGAFLFIEDDLMSVGSRSRPSQITAGHAAAERTTQQSVWDSKDNVSGIFDQTLPLSPFSQAQGGKTR